jgi:hypothetical protein
MNRKWKQSSAISFWAENAVHDHVLQIYDNDDILIESLSGFIRTAVDTLDSSIVIATQNHFHLLESRLARDGISLTLLHNQGHFFYFDAEETLSGIMEGGLPDERLFHRAVTEMINKAGDGKRKLRVFGEMVAILWERGQTAATVRLERLWNNFLQQDSLCLFCAYPASVFYSQEYPLVQHVCSAHTKLIDGSAKSINDVRFIDN